MIRTYTAADLPTLALPGDIGGLLPKWKDAPAVWTGPVEILGDHPLRPDEWRITAYGDGGMGNGVALSRLRLPLARWEARARVVAWAGEGERCSKCDAGKVGYNRALSVSERRALPELDKLGRDDCPDCNGTGYLRAPADLRWALDWSGLTTIPAWKAAALLHASALRLAAGMPSIVELWQRVGVVTADNTPPKWKMVGVDDGHRFHGTPEELLAPDSRKALDDGDAIRVEVPDAR